MEELMLLKDLLKAGKIPDALELIEELEEMSKSDKLNKIFSYGIILLLHLIKQEAENRTTKSWDVSIRNAVKQIQRVNQRHKAKGTYLNEEELLDTLKDAFDSALDRASLEAFEGIYEREDIAAMIDQSKIINQAFELITNSNQQDALNGVEKS
ncbi:protein of unknown function DUF29 [Gloeothece citriformis PCC 7424]|uniref:DUF29 domain-containing protein n=1 Tax=Gloeothece citriformis (strain PCC 7424) TaxID=65393 RepID=B7KBT0_GLOC7|nr:DUF29 family protein [Gloeothece citriformis]ACK73058.1 protein of unknown function DUF29 [Gloeothece citriformis PCC 7424]